MEITATMVKDLRALTGAGVLDCRKALESAGGDFNKAAELLREKGLATAAKKATRQANEGLIGTYVDADGQVAALVEIACESDFVARTPDFLSLCADLARQIATDAAGAATVEELLLQPFIAEAGRSVNDTIVARIAKLGENIVVRRFARLAVSAGAPAGVVGMYVHMGSKMASVVEVSSGSSDVFARPEFQVLLRDLAMQVVASRPNWLTRGDVPASALAQAETDDPAKFYEETVLLEQPFIKNNSKSIQDVVAEASARLGATIAVRRFARLEVGG